MRDVDYDVARFDGAVMLLPYTLRDDARRLIKADRANTEEIRLRIGRSPTALIGGEEISLRRDPVTKRELEWTMDILTQASAHTVNESFKAGYITVRGGYRVGICGTAVSQNGVVTGMKNVSSLAIRISRQITGIADGLVQEIMRGGVFRSTLIISAPGGGKTTLLRDIIRILSNGDKSRGIPYFRVGIADERSELAAAYEGTPQMDVGEHTDVVDACPKAYAMNMLLRAMNPQIIAVDEITQAEDVEAIKKLSHCGTGVIATAHAESLEGMMKRPLYMELIKSAVFEKTVAIHRSGGTREYEIHNMEGYICSE